MSNLWDLDHIQPAGTDVLAGDSIAAMFWNAVAERGPRVWMRQKELGIWKSWTWLPPCAACCTVVACAWRPSNHRTWR